MNISGLVGFNRRWRFPKLTYIGRDTDTANASEYNRASGVSCGDASLYGPHLLIACMGNDNATDAVRDVDLTIGGVDATKLATQVFTNISGGAGRGVVAWFGIENISASVVYPIFTFDDTSQRYSSDWYRLDGCSPLQALSSYGEGGDGAGASVWSVDVPVGGGVAACAMSNDNTAMTWTNLTEDADGTIENNTVWSVASRSGATIAGEQGRSITADWTGGVGSTRNCVLSVTMGL